MYHTCNITLNYRILYLREHTCRVWCDIMFCATDYLTPRDMTSEKFASSYIIEKIPLLTITSTAAPCMLVNLSSGPYKSSAGKVSPAVADGRETRYSGHVSIHASQRPVTKNFA